MENMVLGIFVVVTWAYNGGDRGSHHALPNRTQCLDAYAQHSWITVIEIMTVGLEHSTDYIHFYTSMV